MAISIRIDPTGDRDKANSLIPFAVNNLLLQLKKEMEYGNLKVHCLVRRLFDGSQIWLQANTNGLEPFYSVHIFSPSVPSVPTVPVVEPWSRLLFIANSRYEKVATFKVLLKDDGMALQQVNPAAFIAEDVLDYTLLVGNLPTLYATYGNPSSLIIWQNIQTSTYNDQWEHMVSCDAYIPLRIDLSNNFYPTSTYSTTKLEMTPGQYGVRYIGGANYNNYPLVLNEAGVAISPLHFQTGTYILGSSTYPNYPRTLYYLPAEPATTYKLLAHARKGTVYNASGEPLGYNLVYGYNSSGPSAGLFYINHTPEEPDKYYEEVTMTGEVIDGTWWVKLKEIPLPTLGTYYTYGVDGTLDYTLEDTYTCPQIGYYETRTLSPTYPATPAAGGSVSDVVYGVTKDNVIKIRSYQNINYTTNSIIPDVPYSITTSTYHGDIGITWYGQPVDGCVDSFSEVIYSYALLTTETRDDSRYELIIDDVILDTVKLGELGTIHDLPPDGWGTPYISSRMEIEDYYVCGDNSDPPMTDVEVCQQAFHFMPWTLSNCLKTLELYGFTYTDPHTSWTGRFDILDYDHSALHSTVAVVYKKTQQEMTDGYIYTQHADIDEDSTCGPGATVSVDETIHVSAMSNTGSRTMSYILAYKYKTGTFKTKTLFTGTREYSGVTLTDPDMEYPSMVSINIVEERFLLYTYDVYYYTYGGADQILGANEYRRKIVGIIDMEKDTFVEEVLTYDDLSMFQLTYAGPGYTRDYLMNTAIGMHNKIIE